MGVLCHASALVSVKEDVIDVERSGDKRFTVSTIAFLGVACGVVIDGGDSEKNLIKRTDFDVNLNLVVLKSNKRKSKTGVAAEPELKWDVKCCFRERFARSADSLRNISG